MARTVMIVDDALFMRSILRGILEEHGHRVVAEAASAAEAKQLLRETSPDIITLDIILPDSNSLELLKEIVSTRPASRVLVCSAIGQDAIVAKALELGAKAFLQKPFSPEKVIEALNSLER